MEDKPKVLGIGGVFFKTQDPDATKAWYKKHLGLPTDRYGAMFTFRRDDDPQKKGYLQWSPMNVDTDYFEPSTREFMINYRVRNLEELVEELRDAGVTIVDKIETYSYGKFVHIMDNDGNKLELWEPVDEAFDDMDDSAS